MAKNRKGKGSSRKTASSWSSAPAAAAGSGSEGGSSSSAAAVAAASAAGSGSEGGSSASTAAAAAASELERLSLREKGVHESVSEDRSSAAAAAAAAAATASPGESSVPAAAAAASAAAVSNSLYVRLDKSVTDAQLYDAFATKAPGIVISVRVCRDITTRKSRGYAYVNYMDSNQATQAMNLLQSTLINEKSIKIEYSKHGAQDSNIDRQLPARNIFLTKAMEMGEDLEKFIQGQNLSKTVQLCDPHTRPCRVLTSVGQRILLGIMSHVLNAHKGNKAFNNDFDLRVLRICNEQGSDLWRTMSVCMSGNISTIALTDEAEKKDYSRLLGKIRHMFRRRGNEEYPMLVDSIDSILTDLSGESPPPIPKQERRTQLLQAFAAMIQPATMASMWWNLVRFYDTLDDPERRAFQNAVSNTQYANWGDIVRDHKLFGPVYNYCSPPSYQYHDGMDLLLFARNWFTHVRRQGVRDKKLKGLLPHLPYVFTYHFRTFMPDLLTQLSINFDLTQILVPLP